MKRTGKRCMFGLAAEFETGDALLAAAKESKAAGYTELKAYSPYPVHGLEEVMGHNSRWLAWVMLAGLALGAVGAFYLQIYSDVLVYPLNIGGTPFFSWPAFLPVTFEAAILFAALGLVGFLLASLGLPLPYHPIFNAPKFEFASQNRYFLVVQVQDERFQLNRTRQFLENLNPLSVNEVPC